jgi:hypothetical protein
MSAASELKVVVVGDSPANKTAVATFTAKAASPDVRFTVDGEICCPAMFSYTTIQTQNDISMSENIEIRSRGLLEDAFAILPQDQRVPALLFFPRLAILHQHQGELAA